jgi:cytochrome P450
VGQREGVTFDHYSPELAGPPFWDALRDLALRGPVCRVESYGGYWAATSYDVVLRMMQDWQTFSSAQGISVNRPGPDVMPYIMPLEVDPPRQRRYRQWVNPQLTIRALADLEAPIRDITDAVIDGFAARGSCDIVTEFTRKLPGTVLFRLLFHCTDDDFETVHPWARTVSFSPDPAAVAQASGKLRAWARRTLAARTGEPSADDLVDVVLHLAASGIDVSDDEYLTALQIFIQGGIGTAANATGTIVRVLAEDQVLQCRVRGDRSLIPALVEECVRLEAPTALLFRTATRDAEVAGRHIVTGDKVGLFVGAANRDPTVFARPDDVDLDRLHNRHLSFGAGPHRCIGSNLARLQIRVFVDELLSRIGPFRIPAGAALRYAGGQTRGLASMPLEFEPA